MPISPCRLIKNSLEFISQEEITRVPRKTRGIYVLCRHRPRLDAYDVVYVGMARGLKTGIAGRLGDHRRNKGGLWTHYSAFEVWDNITEKEVEELEGLFRHLYRFDSKANALNKQGSYKPLKLVCRKQSEVNRPGFSGDGFS